MKELSNSNIFFHLAAVLVVLENSFIELQSCKRISALS